MRFSNVFKILALDITMAASCFSCAKLSQDELLSSAYVTVSAPFKDFAISTADAYSALVTDDGTSAQAWRYVLGDGDAYGVVDYANGYVNIHRADVTGPCSNSSLIAPSCGFTWGSGSNGVYHGANYDFFPNAPGLSATFDYLYTVEADVHHELSGSTAGGISDCGLALGFGTSAAHANAPLASNNLNLPGHTTGQDIVKFMHRYSGTSENFLIEAPINFASNGGFTGYGLSVWNANFNMSKDSIALVNGDYLDFHFKMTFDHIAKTVTLAMTPLQTNKTLALTHAQTVTWKYQASSTATENGEARGGIEFSGGTKPITISDFENSRVSVGFLSNGVARSCAYSNVALKLFKSPNGL